jgi:hypothetical protein
VKKRPTEVTVLGKPFKVDWVPNLEHDGPVCGVTSPKMCWVMIDASLPESQKQDTLLHEILHAIWYEMGIHNEDKNEVEETVITRMATGLLNVLRANPHLVRYLQK